MRREFSAGGVVVRRMRGRWWIAAVRPRRDAGRPVVWALPKGLIDAGERGLETAVREVFEETGLRAAGDRKLGDVRYVYTWEGERIFKVVWFFLLHATGGRIGELPPAWRSRSPRRAGSRSTTRPVSSPTAASGRWRHARAETLPEGSI